MLIPGTTTTPDQTVETKQIEGARDTSDPSGAGSQPTSTGVSPEKRSSAEVLKAAREDYQGNGGGSGDPIKTSSEPPKSGQKFGPLRVPGTDGRPARESDVSQPVRKQVGALEPEGTEELYDAATLQRLVDKTDPYPGSKPSVREHDLAAEKGIPAFKRHEFKGPNQDIGEGGVPKNVSKSKDGAGFLPTDEKRVKDHPAYADYKERRPEQILSHFSSVMLHQQNKRRSGPDREVEVQYGYLKDDKGNLRLFSSANSLKGQRWLRDNSSGSQLLDHVRKAAMSNKQDVSRHARKLLFFEENQKGRKEEIRNDKNLTEKDRSRLLNDLEDADKIHKEFFTGTHHVVTNTVAEREGQPNNDKKFQRHAEQNIAEQVHRDASKGVGEIAGTKIRCGSCNVELGASVEDGEEGCEVGGMLYPGQAKKNEMDAKVDANDKKGKPESKFSSKPGGRSQSLSPDPTRRRLTQPPATLASARIRTEPQRSGDNNQRIPAAGADVSRGRGDRKNRIRPKRRPKFNVA